MVFVGECITNLLWEKLHFIGHELFPGADFLLLSKGTQKRMPVWCSGKGCQFLLSSAHAS